MHELHPTRICLVLLVIGLFVAGPWVAGAQADVLSDDNLPTGLSAGDSFRVIFVTSGTTQGHERDIDEWDEFVEDYAPSDLTTTWQALLSTEDVSAHDHTDTNPDTDGTGVPIYNMQGELVAADYEALWGTMAPWRSDYDSDTDLENAPAYDENGDEVDYRVWAGTKKSGVAASPPLVVGTFAEDEIPARDAAKRAKSIAGNPLATWSQWMDGTSGTDNDSYLGVYGLSAVITIGSPLTTPEPASILLLGAGGLGLVLRRRRQRRA